MRPPSDSNKESSPASLRDEIRPTEAVDLRISVCRFPVKISIQIDGATTSPKISDGRGESGFPAHPRIRDGTPDGSKMEMRSNYSNKSYISMSENEHEHGGGDHGKDEVTITINNNNYQIHRGNQTVVTIKTLGGVPLADDLEQVNDHKLHLLQDDGSVTIKGGEQFISHPKDSASS